ncbi:Maltodextrin phosphorylase [Thiorhodovibrio winogradskyi]|uniref:Alpha-1,4 glucan phosphorylase n=1 Tax=Thiorhodovibrio winogradskyi TaxID=77007 RepID=A0ABZ0S8K1_9GAMM|nr:glycogen/starch/alpha-glucan phosphorylase [Thiorhodovibrio winogradskyi]
MSPFKDLRESSPNDSLFDLPPLAMDGPGLARDFQHYYAHNFGRDRDCRSSYYPYKALAVALRDRLMERWKSTRAAQDVANCKRTHYLSLEFLMGRAMSNALMNLGLAEGAAKNLHDMGLILEEIEAAEMDAGLGNGGLGRLAACFLDSCATLQLPVKGYGLRYEYGMFRQLIENGHQVEEPDHWLRDGVPWELERPEYTQRIRFGGRTEDYTDEHGRPHKRWVDTNNVLAVPYDIPIPGYLNDTVNTLRLWSAAATDEFDLGEFNAGSYPESVAAKNDAEHITMVLYPNDANECGKELRLRQQYFLASASIKDVMRDWIRLHGKDFTHFAEKNCFQLNDTHPAVSVPELMRQLMDEHYLEWKDAWAITSQTMAYTNHTLLPEALERWPVRLFAQLLPRLLEIIYEINARFLSEVAGRWPGDMDRQRRMSLIEEGDDPQVRMAFLAIVGSFSVNGVAALHSELLIRGLFRDFYELWPDKFNNKTNGVTPRRWLAMCNPGLRELLNDTIGEDWVNDLSLLERLAPSAEDAAMRERWDKIKQSNKERVATMVKAACDVDFPTEFLFDVQVKRIHEYKRQLLNVLHLIYLYARIKRGEDLGTPRCTLFGGKAAPGYEMAKRIIKLINNVAAVVNADPKVNKQLRIAFIPDYRVSVMEVLAPGTDLSEQISTAGKEASGTGNMKFMMNGALTIGTLDGANIEIRDKVGDENFFLFGLTAEEVERTRGHYDPNGIIASSPALAETMALLESGHFCQFEQGIFDPIIHSIRDPNDPWLTAADFDSYRQTQEQVAEAYQDRERWLRMSMLNTAHSGYFSSDRTIAEYNRDIWRLDPVRPPAPGKR